MLNFFHPKFDIEPALNPVDIKEAQAFRYKAFGVVNESGLDKDEYDQKFNHIIIRDRRHRKVVDILGILVIALARVFKTAILPLIMTSKL